MCPDLFWIFQGIRLFTVCFSRFSLEKRGEDHIIPWKNVILRCLLSYNKHMKRDIYRELIKWKNSAKRKPLLMKGARQTGKTYILKLFGEREYKKLHYFNFEREPTLREHFEKDLNPNRIVEELSFLRGIPIEPSEDLIFFDEIQSTNSALNSLKYFEEEAKEYHVVSAGSLLGVKLSSPRAFPVGKVSFLDLYPMSFLEFIEAVAKEKYRQYLAGIEQLEPIPIPFHNELIDLLRVYCFIGGMPEAVATYVATRDLAAVRKVQEAILAAYSFDFSKHASSNDVSKISLIWGSVPAQLARENNKFMFSALKKSARAREYESALHWLKMAGLILCSHSVSKVGIPIKSYTEANSFKVYFLDVGLLCASVGLPLEVIVQGNELFKEFKGALVENYVAQHLVSCLNQPLYYWRNKGGTAEIDFLYENGASICPLEVKAGVNPKGKSLRSYRERNKPDMALRSSLLNLKLDDGLCNVPLYAIGCLDRLLELL